MGSLRLIVAAAADAARMRCGSCVAGLCDQGEAVAGRHDSLLQRRARPGLAGGPRGLRLESQRCPHPFRPELACVGAARDQALLAQSLRRSRAGDRRVRRANATIGLPRIDETSQLCNSYSSVHAVAHELGHVLGLGHEERGCALDERRGTWSGAQHCRQEAVWTWRCGLLEPDDINGVVGLYGGRTSTTSRGSCSAYAPISAPVSLSAERRTQRDRRAALRPAGATGVAPLPRRSDTVRGRLGDRARPQRLPDRVRRAQTLRLERPASASRWRYADQLSQPGRYCYSLWSTDPLGRPSDRPATVWVTV